MVELWSSKPLAWVRFLLLLILHSTINSKKKIYKKVKRGFKGRRPSSIPKLHSFFFTKNLFQTHLNKHLKTKSWQQKIFKHDCTSWLNSTTSKLPKLNFILFGRKKAHFFFKKKNRLTMRSQNPHSQVFTRFLQTNFRTKWNKKINFYFVSELVILYFTSLGSTSARLLQKILQLDLKTSMISTIDF